MDDLVDGLSEVSCDVLVIGGGTAGPMAALKAKIKNPKATVILLEKANVKRSGAISMGHHEISHHNFEADKLDALQHAHHRQIVSAMHVHLDAHNCLEVLVVRGSSADVRNIADTLLGTKGVKHGKLVIITVGSHL